MADCKIIFDRLGVSAEDVKVVSVVQLNGGNASLTLTCFDGREIGIEKISATSLVSIISYWMKS